MMTTMKVYMHVIQSKFTKTNPQKISKGGVPVLDRPFQKSPVLLNCLQSQYVRSRDEVCESCIVRVLI